MEVLNKSFSSNFLEESQELCTVLKVLHSQNLERAIDVLYEAWREGRWVYVFGNGGSAGTATHLVADLSKTICNGPEEKGLKTMSLFDNPALVSAHINDWGWNDLYVNQLSTYYVPGGVGIGISVHGGNGKDLSGAWSQNILKGLQYIKDQGGETIGFSGFDGGAMKDLVDVSINVPINSTPLVEGFHGLLAHLIVFGLKERIHF